MIKAIPREVARFVQSRLGELRVSEARYEDLLGEADQYYPKYLAVLGEKSTRSPQPARQKHTKHSENTHHTKNTKPRNQEAKTQRQK